ncbi:DUF6090 family protein [Winogradskyella sp.]|uniref:DUF6090 family protein n=1 Tax=Winogradskyella sp. TaxID=1883156 RepID=UPI002609063F|nr:DUF6090 family protein [Winogradskyella sp.]
MTKFFRHIRKSLIEQSKMGKYFKYAIGEILLVVIGILIALQINNWNTRRIEDDKANRYVKRLTNQLRKNIERIDYVANDFEKRYMESLQLLPIINGKDTVNLKSKINTLVRNNFFDFHLNLNLNIITEGRENGDMSLIKDDDIREAIYNLSTENMKIIERERISNDDLNSLFVPYLNQHFNFRNSSGIPDIFDNVNPSSLYKNDNYKMLYDQEFENHIFARLEYHDGNIAAYRELKELVLDLLHRIENHND